MRADESVTSLSTHDVVPSGTGFVPSACATRAGCVEPIDAGDTKHLRVAEAQQIGLDRASDRPAPPTITARRAVVIRPAPCLSRRCAS